MSRRVDRLVNTDVSKDRGVRKSSVAASCRSVTSKKSKMREKLIVARQRIVPAICFPYVVYSACSAIETLRFLLQTPLENGENRKEQYNVLL